MSWTEIAIVAYQHGSYSGEVHEPCAPDEDDATVALRARRKTLQRAGGSMGAVCDAWRVVRREPVN